MKITVPIFANRLRNMLSCEDVCKKCPIELGFYEGYPQKTDVFGNKINCGRNRPYSRAAACEICQKFVLTNDDECPCYVLGHSGAIAAARAALALWDAGEHPMQEEGE